MYRIKQIRLLRYEKMILLEKKKLWELPVSIRICDRTLYVLACRVSRNRKNAAEYATVLALCSLWGKAAERDSIHSLLEDEKRMADSKRLLEELNVQVQKEIKVSPI